MCTYVLTRVHRMPVIFHLVGRACHTVGAATWLRPHFPPPTDWPQSVGPSESFLPTTSSTTSHGSLPTSHASRGQRLADAMRALPWLNLGLFALVVAVNANHHAYSPPTWPNSTPDLPIAPAGYAYAIWLVVYLFTAAHLFTDCAFPQHSIYTDAEKPTFLRVCFALSCGFNAGWAMLTNWLQWMNLATVVLFFLMMSLLPIYLFLSRESVEGVTPPSWNRYFASAVAIRLYFSWVCVATVLCFAASLQDILGAYLSFSTYVMLLAYLLVLALTGVVYGNDPVFGLVAIWTLIGVVNKQNPENTLNHHTVDMIQAAAALGSPLMLGMIIISVIRWSLTERPVRYSEVLKPLSSFEDGLLYGTNV